MSEPVSPPVVLFRGGPNLRTPAALEYEPPVNTLDPRYAACADHHVACDCREAEFAEERREQRMEREAMRAAFDGVLAGHETRSYDSDEAPGCMCTGCQLARVCHIYPTTAYGEPS